MSAWPRRSKDGVKESRTGEGAGGARPSVSDGAIIAEQLDKYLTKQNEREEAIPVTCQGSLLELTENGGEVAGRRGGQTTGRIQKSWVLPWKQSHTASVPGLKTL